MQDGELYRAATHELAEYAKSKKADVIVGPEARGFIVGCPVATELGLGFVPARKPHKLPREVERASYDLEYGFKTVWKCTRMRLNLDKEWLSVMT